MDSLKKSRTKVKLKMKILNRKPHQQIKWHGRENFRSWRQGRSNGYLDQKMLNLKESKYTLSMKSGISWQIKNHMNNRHRRRRRNPDERHRQYFNKRINFCVKERDDYQSASSIEHMKETGQEEKLSVLYNNSSIECTEQRRDI